MKRKMVEMSTMIQSYKDIMSERDKKIQDTTQVITEEYNQKMTNYKKEMHKELDAQIRGLM